MFCIYEGRLLEQHILSEDSKLTTFTEKGSLETDDLAAHIGRQISESRFHLYLGTVSDLEGIAAVWDKSASSTISAMPIKC